MIVETLAIFAADVVGHAGKHDGTEQHEQTGHGEHRGAPEMTRYVLLAAIAANATSLCLNAIMRCRRQR